MEQKHFWNAVFIPIIVPIITALFGFYLGIITELTKTLITDWKNYNVIRIKKEEDIIDKNRKTIIFRIYRIGDKKIENILFDFEIRNEYQKDIKLQRRPSFKQISKSLVSKATLGFESFEKEKGRFRFGINYLNCLDEYEFAVELESQTPKYLSTTFYTVNIANKEGVIATFSKWYDFIFNYSIFVVLLLLSIIIPIVISISILLIFRQSRSTVGSADKSGGEECAQELIYNI